MLTGRVIYNPWTEKIYDFPTFLQYRSWVQNPNEGRSVDESITFVSLDKITRLRRMIDDRGLAVEIEVDGGIKIDNVDRVARAGANVIVSGSGIFLEKDYRTTIARMRERAELARR